MAVAVAARERSGKEGEDAKFRREFLEYMKSGAAVHLGIPSHKGPEVRPVPEPQTEGALESILRRIAG